MMNKLSITILILFVMVGVWDVSNRFNLGEVSKNKVQNEEFVTANIPQRLNKSQQANLIVSYDNFNPDKNSSDLAIASEGMSSQEQLMQKGKLDQLYSGDVRIQLSAVVSQKEDKTNLDERYFALVSILNLKDKSMSLNKIQKEDRIYGYLIESISIDKITLVSVEPNSRKITLSIFSKQTYSAPNEEVNRDSQ